MLPGIGVFELVLIGVIAIILFGKRLPEVARNVGKSYGELRKGITELQSTIRTETEDSTDYSSTPNTDFVDDVVEPTAPRLEPPPEDE